MASSIQDQVQALLSVQISETKTRGLPTPDVESAAIFQSIAANLLIYPRTILYVAHLARQGLQAAAQQEQAQIQLVLQDALDMANQSYSITDTSSLVDAQTALLQVQDTQKVSSSSNTFTRFDKSITDFLNSQLAKNVKKPGATALTRPSTEAGVALAADYATLKGLHTDLLDRLYSLAMGVQNFTSSPITTIIGTVAAQRVGEDIQSIIDSITADNSGNNSSDFTNRLIADRAALKALGTSLDYTGDKIDSASSLPVGYSLQAVSGPGFASSKGSSGPFNGFVSTDNIQIVENVGGGSPSTVTGDHTNLLQSLNSPAIYGTHVSYPVSIPAKTHLFLTLTALSSLTGWTQATDGSWTQSTLGGGWQQDPNSGLFTQVFKVTLNNTSSAASFTLAQVITAIQAATGGWTADPSTGTPFTAVEFVQAGTGQLLIYVSGTKYQSIGISTSYGAPDSTGYLQTYVKSAWSQLGFTLASRGTLNSVPTQRIVDAMNILFSGTVTAKLNASDSSITVISASQAPGTNLVISGNWGTIFGLNGTFNAQSSVITLSGTVLGVSTNPVSPLGLMDVGDIVVLPTGTTSVASVSGTSFSTSVPLTTFQPGNVTVTSALFLAWQALNTDVQAQMQVFLGSQFASGMGKLDAAMAALAGNTTPGTINAAISLLNSLNSLISNLLTVLTDPASLLPVGSAATEQNSSNDIVQLLTERNYDKALDYYHRCKVADIFRMNFQTASYSGAFMAAAQGVSQNDINYPNTALDEGLGPSGFQPNRPGTP